MGSEGGIRARVRAIADELRHLYAEREDLRLGYTNDPATGNDRAVYRQGPELARIEGRIAALYAEMADRRDAFWEEVARANADARLTDEEFAALLRLAEEQGDGE